QDRLRLRCRLLQRVRPRRPGEVVEPQPEHDRAPDPVRGPHPARDPIDQAQDDGVDALLRPRRPTQRPLRPHRVAAPARVDRPCGLATPLATLARNLVRATPTVIGRPTCSRTSARSRLAISTGEPATSCIPPTSRNASSIDRPSTTGVVRSKTSNTARLASA